MDALVSVIVPIYNSGRYLGKCIDSILSQSYGRIELLLLDDGSEDESLDIIRHYASIDERVRVFSDANHGVSFVRNKGLDEARGDYILFVDSDDWIDEDAVRILLSLSVKHGADVVACRKNTVRADDSRLRRGWDRERIYRSEEYVELMTRPLGVFCFPWSRLIKRELFEGMRFIEGRVFEDLILMPHVIYKANKVVESQRRLFNYRRNLSSITRSRFSYKAMDEMDGYISNVNFGDEISNRKVVLYSIMFFHTKYYYYTLRVWWNHLDYKAYRDKYSKVARWYWKRLFLFCGKCEGNPMPCITDRIGK